MTQNIPRAIPLGYSLLYSMPTQHFSNPDRAFLCRHRFDDEPNACEGCVKETNEGYRINQHGTIERCDTCNQFESDQQAIDFVRIALSTTRTAKDVVSALRDLLPYAETEAYQLRDIQDSDEASAEACKAEAAIEQAEEILCRLKLAALPR